MAITMSLWRTSSSLTWKLSQYMVLLEPPILTVEVVMQLLCPVALAISQSVVFFTSSRLPSDHTMKAFLGVPPWS